MSRAPEPISPARVDVLPDGTPCAPDYGDVYHTTAGAFAQARHVFLSGNGLPARWQGRDRFVVVETGFGLGLNFIATWDAWRRDPHRSQRLCFVSAEPHPLRGSDLARAHTLHPLPAADLCAALQAQWPPLTTGLHRLSFDDGRVELLLAWGDARAMAQAGAEARPQESPPITVSRSPGNCAMRPCSAASMRQAAFSGSTTTRRGLAAPQRASSLQTAVIFGVA